MPRYAWSAQGNEGAAVDPARTFNVCRVCAQEPVMLNAVVARRLKVDQDQVPPGAYRSLAHAPFDFSPAPQACAACGRMLGAEDD